MSGATRPATGHPPAAARQHGRLELTLTATADKTRPSRCLAAPPLQLSRVRYDNPARPREAGFTLLHLGGMLDGDRYTIDVTLGENAEARVVGAAATAAYRMPDDEAIQDVRLRLAAGSRLAWLPGPLILFGGARVEQRITIELGDGARLDMIDLMVPGRLARGECFRFERYTQRLEVTTSAGEVRYVERTRLNPARRAPGAPGILDTTPVLGSLYMLSAHLDAPAIAAYVAQRTDRHTGATPLPNSCGVLIRMRGDAPHAVAHALSTLREEVCAHFDS